ncbi:MAG: hypothetical protein ACLVJ6_12840 [Merdibacter sp.]
MGVRERNGGDRAGRCHPLADLGHDLQRILLTVLLCFDGISNLATLFYERIALKNYYRGAKVEVEVVDGERIEHRK